MTGPLHGVRVVMMGGLGPGPFCGMLLGDLGAEVVRVDQVREVDSGLPIDFTVRRNQRSIAVNMKDARGPELVCRLVADADAFVDVFRPGVAERLGIGPEVLLAANPRLVYARMTGYGQDGPYADRAGHDINYIALTGALHSIGTTETPVPPLNLIGDYGGGGMLLAVGLLSGISGGTPVRPRPGARRRDGRRGGGHDGSVLRHGARRHLARSSRRQHSGRRGALLRCVPDRRRQARRGGRDRAAVLRRAVSAVSRWTYPTMRVRRAAWHAAQGSAGRPHSAEDPRGVGTAARVARNLRRTGADHRRGAGSSASTSRGGRSLRSTACRSRPRRRGSPEPLPRSRSRRHLPGDHTHAVSGRTGTRPASRDRTRRCRRGPAKRSGNN